jgi:hypothetical protein
MTLTEMPALFLVLVFTFLIACDGRGQPAMLRSVLAGLALGFAILGRQNYLVILPCLILLVEWKSFGSSIGRLFLLGLCAVLVCGPVFLIWGDLVPPNTAVVAHAIRPWHFILSAGYLGLISLIIEPSVYAPVLRRPYERGAVFAVSLATAVILGTPIVPAKTALAV